MQSVRIFKQNSYNTKKVDFIMDAIFTQEINKEAMNSMLIEIKLHVNNKLYEKGYITEEMFTKAKEMILKV